MPKKEPSFYWTRLSNTDNVTGNMFAIFYHDPDRPDKNGECVIIDAGSQLRNGDKIKIPDVTYISNLRNGNNPFGKFNVVGVIISHGHEDHLGALPYVIKDLGMPEVYGFPFTIELCTLMVNYRAYKSRLKVVRYTDNAINLGEFFKAYLIYVTHSIPDSSHIVLRIADRFTYYHGADFKLDSYPVDAKLTDMDKISRFAKHEVDLLSVECVRAEEPGYTLCETDLASSIEKEMQRVEGNIYFTTFSSHIHRMQQAIDIAVNAGRKIVFLGRSVNGKSEIALSMKRLKIPKGSLLNMKQADGYKYKNSNLCFIAAGCQGEPDSAMSKLLTRGVGNFKVSQGDKVIISASCVPGNSDNYYRTVNVLTREGISVTFPTSENMIHTSGHSSLGDLKRFVGKFKNPRFIMPISGGVSQYLAFAKGVAEPRGFGVDNGRLLLPENGQVLEISKSGVTVADSFEINMITIDK